MYLVTFLSTQYFEELEYSTSITQATKSKMFKLSVYKFGFWLSTPKFVALLPVFFYKDFCLNVSVINSSLFKMKIVLQKLKYCNIQIFVKFIICSFNFVMIKCFIVTTFWELVHEKLWVILDLIWR